MWLTPQKQATCRGNHCHIGILGALIRFPPISRATERTLSPEEIATMRAEYTHAGSWRHAFFYVKVTP